MSKNDSIAFYAESCTTLFEELHGQLQRSTTANEISPETLLQKSNRFDMWARNIAALQDAYLPSSLEYRIRNDKTAIEAVKRALVYLAESLEIMSSIVTGNKENETYDVESESSLAPSLGGVKTQKVSETAELLRAIQDGIASLFQLSMIIRKRPETDEYIKAASMYPMDPIFDIVRIGDVYPAVRGTNDWLSNHLGRALTRRRQYLLYRKEHQRKMQEVHRVREGPDGKTVYSGEGASSYHGNDTFPESTPLSLDKQGVQAAPKGPRTQYADSAKASERGTNILRTPPLPKKDDGSRVKYGEHFECPYCWRIQRFEEKGDWKKHVLSDLRPYVCTFKPCDLNMFDSQRQWFDHELQIHRKQWACQFCADNSPRTRPELESHLTKVHDDKMKDGKYDVERCKITRIDATCCLLCTEYAEKLQKSNQSTKCDVSLEQFQQHLGFHMEQLAFAALPPYEIEEDAIPEEDEDSEEQGADELLQELKQEPKFNFSSTIEKINRLGFRYLDQGKLSEAESLLRQTMDILGNAGEIQETLRIFAPLAFTLSNQGKFGEAEALQRQVVELEKETLGLEHPNTLRSMQFLAGIFSQQGKLGEAEQLQRQVLQLREKILGLEHLDTLYSIQVLASTFSHQGKLEEAEQLQRQVLQLREKILGPEHPDTLYSMQGLASIFSRQGKLEETEKLQRQATNMEERILGVEHPDTLTALEQLSNTLSAEGKIEEAEKLRHRVLTGREKVLGQEHPHTRRARESLAAVLVEKQKMVDSADNPVDTGDSSMQASESLPSKSAKEVGELEDEFVVWGATSKKSKKDKKKGKVFWAPLEEETMAPGPSETPHPLHTEQESAEVQAEKATERKIASAIQDDSPEQSRESNQKGLHPLSALDPETEGLQNSPGTCWDSIPAYHLDQETVNEFLQSLFGYYDYYTKLSMDHYQFWVPRKLTNVILPENTVF
ncbi:hypothetical protein G7Y89_g3617 [Cudoniella acicularis]|uniref:Oxidoreductase acuF-like C2H2 type zinc-finger domain-containing protein n=1 Tax=Cudoniella acicularis TaxID=354080 RepID=A0A8H4RU02_9HELO|nr:hypothetical protein G7Y89_g3617 [Cudoniella acicularis]